MSFDFNKAWLEVAYPAYLALPSEIKDLVWDTLVLSGDLSQLNNLSMPWPNGEVDLERAPLIGCGSLKLRFEEIDPKQLAEASHVVYCWGHWSTNTWPHDKGVYWKFSSYADQVLKKRLGLTPPPKLRGASDNGIRFDVQSGSLKVCCSTPYSWFSRDIGLATPEMLDKAKAHTRPQMRVARRRIDWSKYEDEVEVYFTKLTELRSECSETMQKFFNIVELYPE